jgi:hypothetical protein
MRTAALCLKSDFVSICRASGAVPLTSPPVDTESFDPAVLSGYDFYYFKLHGLPADRFWYGDSYVTTCSNDQLAAVDMTGAVVFVANDHTLPADGSDNSPMIAAIFRAGAQSIIVVDDNAPTRRIAGVDLFGRTFRLCYEGGMPVDKSLTVAKLRIQNKIISNIPDFKLLTREN